MLSVAELISKKVLKKTDVLFTCCTHRNFHVDAMTNVINLIANKKHNITWAPMKGDALIDRSRSRIASFFMLERKDDILFMVDDDQNFKTEDVVKVIDNMVKDDLDICGGLVMLKKPVKRFGNYIDKNVLFFDGQEVTFSQDAKPVEIRYLGSGFMAVKRHVLQRMIDTEIVPLCHPHDLKFWPFFQPFPYRNESGDYVYLSEDWAFCERARSLGFKVWLDPSIQISHYGEYGWDLSDVIREPKKVMDGSFSVTLG